MRSRTGCLTCRQRKLKCDEKKPVCGQCIKASRECIPSSGIVFRHQHNASMNGDDSGDENSLKGFYSYKNTFEDDAIWLDIPRNVTFINTTNPYLDPATPDLETMSVTSMDSPAPFHPKSTNSWPSSTSYHSLTSTPSSAGPELAPTSVPMCYTPELDALPPLMQSPPSSTVNTPISPPASLCNRRIHPIMDWSGALTPPPIDPRLTSPFDTTSDFIPRSCSMSSSRQSPPRSNSETFMSKDQEVAFLLRYFSEHPARWLDLFDTDAYFASYVPLQARDNSLVRNAAVACAAKALAHVHGRRSGGRCQVKTEVFPGSSTVDWKHKAAHYYDNAVSCMLQALKSDATITPDDSDCEFLKHNDELVHPMKRRRTSSNVSTKSGTDEILAASVILCAYEYLDVSMSEWAKHLNGAKSLLVHSQERMMPYQMQSPGSPILTSSLSYASRARRSTFWNIARQDLYAAFINKNHTHLDTEDISLWRDAGLLIDDQGFLVSNNLVDNSYSDHSLNSNGLVWLMAKLMNFIAAGDELPTEMGMGMGFASIPTSTLLDYWYLLRKQFQAWHDSLPVTFKPSSRVELKLEPGQHLRGESEATFPEVWYNIPMCAATMQDYHMSQILLFMNKPHESTQGRSTVCARLNSYQSVLAACQKHSREIVGISLAQSDDASRLYSVQALFVAGQCLGDAHERQVVLDLLRGIQAEVGIATEYRIRQLTEQWQWEAAQQNAFIS